VPNLSYNNHMITRRELLTQFLPAGALASGALLLGGCSSGSSKTSNDEAFHSLSDKGASGASQTNQNNGATPQQAAANYPGGSFVADVNNNIFLDALAYTGYNIDKHRADGYMWKYVLRNDKPGRGWLSNITYGDGCSGYETTSEGLPNIGAFENGGLVCATYFAYVYFNYLPRVVGIDTSCLAKGEPSYSANAWLNACRKWVADGYSREVGFKAWCASGYKGQGLMGFSLEEDIPVGSVFFTTDANNPSDVASHVSIYAGCVNDYHWVTHVGNVNGPEFCAMERFNYGADPQWPIAVITLPNFIV